jgi:hypothetical protein
MKLCVTILLIFGIITPSKEKGIVVNKVKVVLEPHQIVYNTLLEEGIDSTSAQIMVAQASFESGYFKNSLTRNSKNCFALLHWGKRKTLSLGGHGFAEGRSGYAVFSSIDSAAVDYLYYLEARKLPHKIKTPYLFALALKQKNYYGYYKLGDTTRITRVIKEQEFTKPAHEWALEELNSYSYGLHVHRNKLFK